MTRSIAVLSSLALLGAACASEPVKSPGVPPPVSGKQEAPVQVSAELAQGSAKVTFDFQRDARAVTIEFAGLDGLRITSPTRAVTGAEFPAGSVASLEVTFEAPPGESNLSVFVTGRFDGLASSKVANITVGSPSSVQRQKALQAVKVNAQGEPIREVPMTPRP